MIHGFTELLTVVKVEHKKAVAPVKDLTDKVRYPCVFEFFRVLSQKMREGVYIDKYLISTVSSESFQW